MASSIQVSVELLEELKSRKLYERESYEEVIRDLLEDTRLLNEKTRREIEKTRIEIKQGNFYSIEDVRRELDL